MFITCPCLLLFLQLLFPPLFPLLFPLCSVKLILCFQPVQQFGVFRIFKMVITGRLPVAWFWSRSRTRAWTTWTRSWTGAAPRIGWVIIPWFPSGWTTISAAGHCRTYRGGTVTLWSLPDRSSLRLRLWFHWASFSGWLHWGLFHNIHAFWYCVIVSSSPLRNTATLVSYILIPETKFSFSDMVVRYRVFCCCADVVRSKGDAARTHIWSSAVYQNVFLLWKKEQLFVNS